jgi:tetratricopeptide (TPR) repeat protein
MPTDAYGNLLSAAPDAAEHFRDAVDRRLRYDGGVLEAARAAVAADPLFAAGHALLALVDPTAAGAARAQARAALRQGSPSEFERSFVGFLDVLVRDGMWAAEQVGLRHAADHPADLLGVGLAATIVERSCRPDVQEAVLAVYEPSRRLLGDDPYLLCMVGFVAQEQGRFAEAGEMAERALAASPRSTTAAHLRAHVHVETADHAAGLAWLDVYHASMDPRSDYHHHLGWHAALHALALGDADSVLARLAVQAAPETDALRQVVDTGTLLMRCRLCGLVGPDEDPTGGRGGRATPAMEHDPPSMYVAAHLAVGLAVQKREARLRRLAARAPALAAPGLAELLGPLCTALADIVAGDHAAGADGLGRLRPTMDRWGGSRAQRDVIEDILVEAALRGGRLELARQVLTERLDRRPNRWDAANLARAVASAPGP